jgi:hypothetical protein
VTAEQYDETISRLKKLGNWPPEELEYHVAFRSNGEFRVSEIWDSWEQFDAFGAPDSGAEGRRDRACRQARDA